jgi:hypothetical protein
MNTICKGKMARPAEDREALKAQHEEPTSEDEIYQESQEGSPSELSTDNRRDTITKKTVKKLRIWELENLDQIQEWDDFDKHAALKIQQSLVQDYEKIMNKYNELLTQSKEQILELQDGIEQLQEVINDDKKTIEKQATVIEYLQQQNT